MYKLFLECVQTYIMAICLQFSYTPIRTWWYVHRSKSGWSALNNLTILQSKQLLGFSPSTLEKSWREQWEFQQLWHGTHLCRTILFRRASMAKELWWWGPLWLVIGFSWFLFLRIQPRNYVFSPDPRSYVFKISSTYLHGDTKTVVMRKLCRYSWQVFSNSSILHTSPRQEKSDGLGVCVFQTIQAGLPIVRLR